jgi:hypothetical protein
MDWYLESREFQICLVFGILFPPTVGLSRTDFSSFADAQNSVTSKLLVWWGCISNRWKAGRVIQLFGIQLRGRIPPEQPKILFSFGRYNLSRLAVFSNPVILQKAIVPKPWIGWGQVNTRSKAVDVLYFWYSTLSQISEGTAPDLNLLTFAHCQGQIDVVIRFFLTNRKMIYGNS